MSDRQPAGSSTIVWQATYRAPGGREGMFEVTAGRYGLAQTAALRQLAAKDIVPTTLSLSPKPQGPLRRHRALPARLGVVLDLAQPEETA